jgi:DNA-binding MarR family transcriptional regulator
MTKSSEFDLADFLPYALNQAAEATSLGFRDHYKSQYGMLRTEWRVIFHLGRYGKMTAKEICARASLHKTKVSRAVAALEQKRLITRNPLETDRRHEVLELTKQGFAVFGDLFAAARDYDAKIGSQFTEDELVILRRCLATISAM